MNIKYTTCLKLIGLLLFTLLAANCEHVIESNSVTDQRTIDSLQYRINMSDWGDVPRADLEHLLRIPDLDSLEVEDYLEKLRPVFLSPPEEMVVENWNKLSDPWYKEYGGLARILFFAQLAVDQYLKEGDYGRATQFESAIGRLHFIESNFPLALKTQHRALNYATKSGDSLHIGWALNQIGCTLAQSNDLINGEVYFQRAAGLAERNGYPGLKAMTLMNLGIIESYNGEGDCSISLLEEALEMGQEQGLSAFVSLTKANIANTYNYTNRYKEAIAFLQENDEFLTATPSPDNTLLHLHLASAFAGIGENEQAEHYFEISCAMADSLNYPLGRLFCWDAKSEYYSAAGDFEAAHSALLEYQRLYVEQTGIERAKAIQSLETQFRLKEKDNKINQLMEEYLKKEKEDRQQRKRLLIFVCLIGLGLLSIFYGMHNWHQAKSAGQKKIIAETKLQVLQSQMNPHFIFNALGGIQNYILKSKKIEAYNYLGKFAALLRMIASNSANIHIELEEEIKFIRTYLDLEKLRFRKNFNFYLKIDDELLNNNHNIPSMMIQPVVENAIIHGLSGLDRPGELEIEILSCPQRLGITCIVTDNGRGREAAAVFGDAENRGEHLSIASINIQQRLRFLQSIGYGTAEVTIKDLYDGKQANGTQVRIRIPFMDKQNII